MRKKWVIANWKMNGEALFIKEWAQSAEAFERYISADLKIVICPSFPYLGMLKQSFLNHKAASLWVGAQNVSEQLSGAFTGEVSASMLVDAGVQAAIIGHSERRHIYHETNELIAQKVEVALSHHLTPILCIGETLDQRESGVTYQVLKGQLAPVINLIGTQLFSQIIIAYEPVWAIGTGKTATPELAEETHADIRKILAEYDLVLASQMSILYGGSLKPDNAADLFSQPNIDGGLVGGASLLPCDFLAIVNAFNVVH